MILASGLMVNIASGYGNSQKGLKKFLFWQTMWAFSLPYQTTTLWHFPQPLLAKSPQNQ
jgi:hypothetical protein